MKSGNETTIFIVDDDKLFTGVLKNEIMENFAHEDPEIFIFEAGEQCELSMKKGPDIAIIDFHLNSKYRDAMNGIQLTDMIKATSPQTEIIMFTREESIDIARKAFDHGAYDYVMKNDLMFQRLNISLQQCLTLRELKRELKIQKNRGLFAVILIAVLLSIVTTIQIFAPHLL